MKYVEDRISQSGAIHRFRQGYNGEPYYGWCIVASLLISLSTGFMGFTDEALTLARYNSPRFSYGGPKRCFYNKHIMLEKLEQMSKVPKLWRLYRVEICCPGRGMGSLFCWRESCHGAVVFRGWPQRNFRRLQQRWSQIRRQRLCSNRDHPSRELAAALPWASYRHMLTLHKDCHIGPSFLRYSIFVATSFRRRHLGRPFGDVSLARFLVASAAHAVLNLLMKQSKVAPHGDFFGNALARRREIKKVWPV